MRLCQASLAVTIATVFMFPVMPNGLFAYFVSPAAPFVFPGVSFLLGVALFALSLLFVRRKPENSVAAVRSAVIAG